VLDWASKKLGLGHKKEEEENEEKPEGLDKESEKRKLAGMPLGGLVQGAQLNIKVDNLQNIKKEKGENLEEKGINKKPEKITDNNKEKREGLKEEPKKPVVSETSKEKLEPEIQKNKQPEKAKEDSKGKNEGPKEESKTPVASEVSKGKLKPEMQSNVEVKNVQIVTDVKKEVKREEKPVPVGKQESLKGERPINPIEQDMKKKIQEYTEDDDIDDEDDEENQPIEKEEKPRRNIESENSSKKTGTTDLGRDWKEYGRVFGSAWESCWREVKD